ncbi:aldo/keto reductase [bacterium]|nr:aldo/keto reductase [bacterium]
MRKDQFGLNRKLTRREFLKKGSFGLAGAGLALTGLSMFDTQRVFANMLDDIARQKSRMFYRKLGKTGLMVSEIIFNGGLLKDPSVLAYAIDLGLNYVDTSRTYGDSEELVGKILKYKRDNLIVATKWRVEEKYKVQDFVDSLNESLKSLGSDYIDIIQVWAARRQTQINHEPMFEAFEKLKKDGKVRFLGISNHINTPVMSREIVKNGRYDMMNVMYNYRNHEEMDTIIGNAYKKNMGIIGQLITDGYENIEGPFSGTLRGAIQWALNNKHLTAVDITMRNVQEVDEILQIPSLLRK